MLVGIAVLFALCGAANAQPVVYTWSGSGKEVPGSTNCTTYKMVIEVTVDGSSVKGKFQQEGRPQRTFETTLGKNGEIKTAAMVGGGGMVDVMGQIGPDGSKIKIYGYCDFEGPLTRKP